MAFLLRQITKPKWLPHEWCPQGEVPADALTDLRAAENALSVWHIELDESDVNKPHAASLLMALAALASARDRLDKLDYVLVREDILSSMEIECTRTDGQTPHIIARSAAHRDLVKLTVRKVVKLSEEIMGLQHHRLAEKGVVALLLEALRNGHLDREQLKPDLLKSLEDKLEIQTKSASASK